MCVVVKEILHKIDQLLKNTSLSNLTNINKTDINPLNG